MDETTKSNLFIFPGSSAVIQGDVSQSCDQWNALIPSTKLTSPLPLTFDQSQHRKIYRQKLIFPGVSLLSFHFSSNVLWFQICSRPNEINSRDKCASSEELTDRCRPGETHRRRKTEESPACCPWLTNRPGRPSGPRGRNVLHLIKLVASDGHSVRDSLPSLLKMLKNMWWRKSQLDPF